MREVAALPFGFDRLSPRLARALRRTVGFAPGLFVEVVSTDTGREDEVILRDSGGWLWLARLQTVDAETLRGTYALPSRIEGSVELLVPAFGPLADPIGPARACRERAALENARRVA